MVANFDDSMFSLNNQTHSYNTRRAFAFVYFTVEQKCGNFLFAIEIYKRKRLNSMNVITIWEAEKRNQEKNPPH